MHVHPLISDKLAGPISIAVDYINDKIYVAEKGSARIDVFSGDGRMRTNLVTTDIVSPTSLALDPNESYLFFTDAGHSTNKALKPKIERLFMDGTGRLVIVSDKMLEPVAITLDPIKKRVYWVDKKYDHLETCDYFGLRRHVIASGSQNLPHTIALDVFENTIYYADSTKLAILKFARHTFTTAANITYHYKLGGSSKPQAVKIFHSSKQLSRPNPCAVNNSGCEHFCLLSHRDSSQANSYRCKCKIGYQLRRDLKTCEPVNEYLYFSQLNTIRAIPFDQNAATESRVPIILQTGAFSRGIEADIKNNRTFFYDISRRAIYQSLFNGDEPRVLVPNNLYNAESLSYDWISKNLYFSDFNKIVVVQVDNVRNRRDLIVSTGRIFDVVVDPASGFLFYSDVRRPAKILRAFLDGTNITVIKERELGLPQRLAIDFSAKRIYWADSLLSKIQYSDYDGRNLNTLNIQNLATPISIFIYKSFLFYIDARTSSINRVSKTFATIPVRIRVNVNGLDRLKVFGADLQQIIENHPCGRQNGDCSHFCFAVPSPDSQYQVSRHCGCPFGFKLDTNMATCVINAEEPIVAPCNGPYQFRCANDRCIR